jgi:hypothetical protein
VKEKDEEALDKLSDVFMEHKWREEKRINRDQLMKCVKLFVDMIWEEGGQETIIPFAIISIGVSGLNGAKYLYIAKKVLRLSIPRRKCSRDKYSRIWNSLEAILQLQQQTLMANYTPFPRTAEKNSRIEGKEKTAGDAHSPIISQRLPYTAYLVIVPSQSSMTIEQFRSPQLEMATQYPLHLIMEELHPLRSSNGTTPLPSNTNPSSLQQQPQQQQQQQKQQKQQQQKLQQQQPHKQERLYSRRGMINGRTGEQEQVSIRQLFETEFVNTDASSSNIQARTQPEKRSPKDNTPRTNIVPQRTQQPSPPRFTIRIDDSVVPQRATSLDRPTCRIFQQIHKSLQHY